MRIADREIGCEHPVFIQAEVGVTHMGNVEAALALVDAAQAAGADAVKFILTDPATLTDTGAALIYEYAVPGGMRTGRKLGDLLREAMLTDAEWRQVRDHARERGLIFYVTVDHPSGVDLGEALDVPAYKLCAWDIDNLDLVAAIAKTGKPMVADIGTARVQEHHVLREYWWAITTTPMLSVHAPHPSADGRDWHMRRLWDHLFAGFSSPGRESWCDFLALGRGVSLLEKRLTLSTLETRGHHHAVALDPQEFAAWVREVRLAERSLGEMPFGGSDHAWNERAKWGGIRR